ncbi:unnamed protein product [Clonostachys byssicola]|uniref:Uncharacterized protein n=1 Tax=Clonostachys byssicola TaxID=160290 RepID=A0A9N9Y2P3_9HYPO|nr:unnamed protein product [Clonostachys byssicola]
MKELEKLVRIHGRDVMIPWPQIGRSKETRNGFLSDNIFVGIINSKEEIFLAWISIIQGWLGD